MVNVESLREMIAGHHEWLLIRELGRTFPLERHEIEIIETDGKAHFGFLDDKGFHSWRLNSFAHAGGEISIDVAGAFARRRETMRLVPRTPAAELTAAIELARLEAANDIARLIAAYDPAVRVGRVALNEENGRFAQIQFDAADGTPMAAMADVTAKVTVEATFTAAMLWLDKLGLRKKRPVNDLWIICEKRQARNAQKLHALLSDRWKSKLSIVEIDRRHDPLRLVELAKRRVRDLWREKAPKLTLPASPEPSVTAGRIISLAPSEIDLIYSRHGETLRFNGLPFARVRVMMGIEKAWFGFGQDRRLLKEENWRDLKDLVSTLRLNRSADPPNKRHKLYRAAPEAWFESILRRDISLLDANLILSPIYNQFRSSNDKIDLLAIRRDGRLVIIELKTQPDREMIFQSIDYWRKIELQRRLGILAAADLFAGREILDKPAVIYLAAPAWSFHRDAEYFARAVSSEIELWRFELHEAWRERVRVVSRLEHSDGLANR